MPHVYIDFMREMIRQLPNKWIGPQHELPADPAIFKHLSTFGRRS